MEGTKHVTMVIKKGIRQRRGTCYEGGGSKVKEKLAQKDMSLGRETQCAEGSKVRYRGKDQGKRAQIDTKAKSMYSLLKERREEDKRRR